MSGIVHAQPTGLGGFQVLRVHIADQRQLDVLLTLEEHSHEFEIWTDALGIGQIDVRVSPAQRRALEQAGLEFTVHIEDLQATYNDLFQKSAGGDFFDTYQTYDDHVAFLTDLVAAHPNLAEMVDLGPSVENRHLWAIHITGPGVDKPGVMYHGGQHGNEIIGPPIIAYAAQQLLTRYGVDPDITAVVDAVDWYLLPIMNPDGYESGNRYNANNMDLNRNWDGPGSRPDPFSEPETSAMRDFFVAHPKVRTYIDIHSSGYMIMWPWAYTDAWCEDHSTFDVIVHDMHDQIEAVYGTDYSRMGPVYTTIYPVNGASVDYTYGIHDIWSITFEVGVTQHPGVQNIRPMSEELFPALVYLSAWTYDCNSNRINDADEVAAGSSEDCDANGTLDECEPGMANDFDGDGTADRCDSDIDNDTVPNEVDVCDFTIAGSPVHSDGRPIGDRNQDCNCDLTDYQRFTYCVADQTTVSADLIRWCLVEYDFDGDNDVDVVDFSLMQRAFSGPQ